VTEPVQIAIGIIVLLMAGSQAYIIARLNRIEAKLDRLNERVNRLSRLPRQ
jgi:hypothetical protein